MGGKRREISEAQYRAQAARNLADAAEEEAYYERARRLNAVRDQEQKIEDLQSQVDEAEADKLDLYRRYEKEARVNFVNTLLIRRLAMENSRLTEHNLAYSKRLGDFGQLPLINC